MSCGFVLFNFGILYWNIKDYSHLEAEEEIILWPKL